MAKMKRMPFQNKGHIEVRLKQNICYDVSGPFPTTVDGFKYSFNAICKKTRKRWRASGKLKSESSVFLMHLIANLNNTTQPPGRVEALTTDHGGESTSNSFQQWLKQIQLEKPCSENKIIRERT